MVPVVVVLEVVVVPVVFVVPVILVVPGVTVCPGSNMPTCAVSQRLNTVQNYTTVKLGSPCQVEGSVGVV